MEPLLRQLAEPFERMTETQASALLRELYALEVTALERLDTERDDSFHVTAADGRQCALKVAHPADDPHVLDLQLAALTHAALVDPDLPLPRVLPSARGELVPHWQGRSVQLFSWLPGDLLRNQSPTAAELRQCGVALGRLSRALSDFGHPAAGRTLAWDLQRLGSLRSLARDDLTLGVIDRFDRVVGPALHELPHQVIHNDFHGGNVLVAPGSETYVTGILDFGDVVHSARICDLGVALAYLIPAEGPAWTATAPVLDGFESVVPLLAAERELLPDLVAARLVQRILINGVLAEARTDATHSAELNRSILRNLLSER